MKRPGLLNKVAVTRDEGTAVIVLARTSRNGWGRNSSRIGHLRHDPYELVGRIRPDAKRVVGRTGPGIARADLVAIAEAFVEACYQSIVFALKEGPESRQLRARRVKAAAAR